ncbi:Hypothetical protein A7982_10783 [Minicystis rosea]|nr:Hypothetical protein A7982_10783 [Minicystis rosea]
MKALLALVPVTLFALANCGTSDIQSPPSGDETTANNGGPHKTCRPTCNTPADCATPNQPLQDASHFACTNHRCEWLGCQSSADCTSALMTTKVTCSAAPGEDVSSCIPTCQTAADCGVQGNALGDSSHFACNAGKCEWLGCKSTADCTGALQTTRVVCDKPAGSAIATCMPTCTKPADCAVPGSKLNDASHFACNAGKCEWLGCKTTAECTADFHVSNVICE